MTTVQNLLAVAKSQLGYTERGNNITKFWAELDPGLQGQPWCAGFVSWVFKHAGAPLPAMGKEYGFVYCPSAVGYAKAHGLFSDSGRYAPGDIVLYGPGGGSHTGIIVADDGATMTIIEGNTSPDGSSGSQTNGGGVYLRHRPHSAWVYGVLQGSKMLNPTTPPPPPPPIKTEEQLMADLVMTNPMTKGPATAANGLSNVWRLAWTNNLLIRQLLAKEGVAADLDESLIAKELAASLAAPLKAALVAEVAKGGSPDAIADAVVTRMAAQLAGS